MAFEIEYRIWIKNRRGVGSWTFKTKEDLTTWEEARRKEGCVMLAKGPADKVPSSNRCKWEQAEPICRENGWLYEQLEGQIATPPPAPAPGPRKPIPQCPPEVWQVKPPEPERCWEAVLAMCGARKA